MFLKLSSTVDTKSEQKCEPGLSQEPRAGDSSESPRPRTAGGKRQAGSQPARGRKRATAGEREAVKVTNPIPTFYAEQL